MSFRLGFEHASTTFSIGGPFRRPNGSLQSDLFECQNGYPKIIAFGHPTRPGGAPPREHGSREHGKLDDSSAFLRHFPAGEAGAGILPNIMRDLGSPRGGHFRSGF